MTAQSPEVAVNVIGSLMDATAAAVDGHTFARRFGDPRPSERRLGGLHVVLPDGPFEGLDIRPWTASTVGVVDIDLRAGTALDWTALQQEFGPFRVAPQLDPGPPWFSAFRTPTGAAPVLLLVEVRGDVVSGIALRRDPPPRNICTAGGRNDRPSSHPVDADDGSTDGLPMLENLR